MMRTMLYEAAQSMLAHSNKWSWLKAWAMQIARRVYATRYRTQRVCCDDCRRSMLNARARARVRHEQIDCAVCGELFTPKRNDAVTCSNRCRQRLFRQRAR
jgi:predicted nucleic acid-binding Zn ribbon protein